MLAVQSPLIMTPTKDDGLVARGLTRMKTVESSMNDLVRRFLGGYDSTGKACKFDSAKCKDILTHERALQVGKVLSIELKKKMIKGHKGFPKLEFKEIGELTLTFAYRLITLATCQPLFSQDSSVKNVKQKRTEVHPSHVLVVISRFTGRSIC
jgi:hypothetical protein